MLDRNTKILMSDGMEKKIEEIRSGEEVKTKYGVAKITEIFMGVDENMISVKTAYGAEITTSQDHVILTEKGWVRADRLKEDDILYNFNHNEDNVRMITVVDGGTMGWELVLDGPVEYYANKILVGDINKSRQILEVMLN